MHQGGEGQLAVPLLGGGSCSKPWAVLALVRVHYYCSHVKLLASVYHMHAGLLG